MEETIKNLTEEQFDEMFTPQINHIERAKAENTGVPDDSICSFNGCMYETYGEDIDYVLKMAEENRVVTIVEGEDEDDEDGELDEDGEIITHSTWYYSSGYHLVNRIGYLILDKPYLEDFEVKLEW